MTLKSFDLMPIEWVTSCSTRWHRSRPRNQLLRHETLVNSPHLISSAQVFSVFHHQWSRYSKSMEDGFGQQEGCQCSEFVSHQIWPVTSNISTSEILQSTRDTKFAFPCSTGISNNHKCLPFWKCGMYGCSKFCRTQRIVKFLTSRVTIGSRNWWGRT